METKERLKEIIEAKSKELEELRKKLPSSRDKKYGTIKHPDPISLWEKIEELEAEIEKLKENNKD
jgi:hypothetical protein